MSLKLRNQESEIARLRTQLSAAVTPSSEVESRLSTLTQTLVSKQQALESLTTERNALRLQLEKIEVRKFSEPNKIFQFIFIIFIFYRTNIEIQRKIYYIIMQMILMTQKLKSQRFLWKPLLTQALLVV